MQNKQERINVNYFFFFRNIIVVGFILIKYIYFRNRESIKVNVIKDVSCSKPHQDRTTIILWE